MCYDCLHAHRVTNLRYVVYKSMPNATSCHSTAVSAAQEHQPSASNTSTVCHDQALCLDHK